MQSRGTRNTAQDAPPGTNSPEGTAKRKPTGTVGFWVRENDIVENKTSHVRAIVDNPEKFGLSGEYVKGVYEHYGEPLGNEGKAREDIIKEAARNGWIRVRHYVNKHSDYWSIQGDSIPRRRGSIDNFIFWALEHRYLTGNDALLISAYDEGGSEYYEFASGGVAAYREDAKKRISPE